MYHHKGSHISLVYPRFYVHYLHVVDDGLE